MLREPLGAATRFMQLCKYPSSLSLPHVRCVWKAFENVYLFWRLRTILVKISNAKKKQFLQQIYLECVLLAVPFQTWYIQEISEFCQILLGKSSNLYFVLRNLFLFSMFVIYGMIRWLCSSWFTVVILRSIGISASSVILFYNHGAVIWRVYKEHFLCRSIYLIE